MMRTGKHCFSLVELLVVIVIILLIMGISGPAFTKLFSGTAVEASSRMVGSQLRLARQYAITHRTRVAVLLPGNQGGSANNDKKFSAMRACTVNKSTGDWEDWVPGTKWVFLTKGAVIHKIENSKDFTTPGTCKSIAGIEPTGDDWTSRAIIFKPTGRLDGAQQYIHIAEGVYDDSLDNGSLFVKPNSTNWIDLSLDQYTGRLAYKHPEDPED